MKQRDDARHNRNPLRRVASAVGRVFRRNARHAQPAEKPAAAEARRSPEHRARGARRETDIPMEALARSYSPTQTSLKAPFRADGSDHHRDQEYGRGPEDDRWNDEDRFTNKSGDPRIGTHGRTYEANENRNQEGEREWTRTRP